VLKSLSSEEKNWTLGHTSEPYPAELLTGPPTLCHASLPRCAFIALSNYYTVLYKISHSVLVILGK
jgi:hypothetical protein